MSLQTYSDLVPRPELRASLMSRLERGSLLLYGARRIGKSTLLQGLADGPPEGWVFIRVDLEGFLEQPLVALPEQVALHLRKVELLPSTPELADRVESVGLAGANMGLRAAPEQPWWSRLQKDLESALDKLDGRTLVVALDEVPWWLDAVERDAEGGGEGSPRRTSPHPAG
jgi:hypothetical protein